MLHEKVNTFSRMNKSEYLLQIASIYFSQNASSSEQMHETSSLY